MHRGPKYLSKGNTTGLYQLAHLLSITSPGCFENSLPGHKILLPPVAFRRVLSCHDARAPLPTHSLLALQLPGGSNSRSDGTGRSWSAAAMQTSLKQRDTGPGGRTSSSRDDDELAYTDTLVSPQHEQNAAEKHGKGLRARGSAF